MKKQHINGKVLSLLKNIHLQPGENRLRQSFFMGPRGRIGTFVTDWWTTWDTRLVLHDLVSMIMQSDSALKAADVESLADAIMETLREVAIDESLFNTSKLLRRQGAANLYDAINCPIPAFTSKLSTKFHDACLNALCKWFVLFPIQKVQGPPWISLGNGVELISTDNTAKWGALATSFPILKEFDPHSGRAIGIEFRREQNFTAWLVAQLTGTEFGARNGAIKQMKTVLAVLFSVASQETPSINIKTGWKPSTRCLQFNDAKATSVEIGNLMPPVSIELRITSSILSQVEGWFQDCSKASPERSIRAAAASEFLHRGVVASGVERFLFFFISLDALFGERGRVEAEILSGVSSVHPQDSSWVDRCRLLFDLRSELVHGATTSIQEWRELGSYRKRFRSEPEDDILELAMRSLRSYFTLPPPAEPSVSYQI